MTTLTDELKLLAAEYALGTLEGAERQRAEALETSADDFRAAVDRWRAHLLALDDTAALQLPDPQLWARIQAGLDARSVYVKPRRKAWLKELAFWRWLGLAGAVTSSLLAALLWISVHQEPQGPSHVAVLSTPDGRAAAIINAYSDGTAEFVPLEQLAAPQGQTIEVWTQQPDMKGPVSIGRLDVARRIVFDLKSLGAPGGKDFFALTFEPSGGSPSGTPTGAILMKGVAAEPL